MVLVPVQQLWLPWFPACSNAPSFTNILIDATGEKIAFVGRVWNRDRTTKSVRKVGFRAGPVTSAGGSGIALSLQDVDLVNGPPYQPDGTPDQTVNFALNTVTAQTWFQTAALSADRSVAFGALLAVVIEFDGGGRLGADALNATGLAIASSGHRGGSAGSDLLSGTWSSLNIVPNVILEFSDGTFGTIGSKSWPASAINSPAFNSGSAPDERALEFTVPFACNIDGCWAMLNISASADFDFVLYNGTTVMATTSVDSNAIGLVGALLYDETIQEQVLAPGNTYRLSVRPTTVNNVTLYDFDVNDVNHFQAHAGWPGGSLGYNSRTDAGAWGAVVTTKRPFMGLRFSAIDSGGGVQGSRIALGM